MILQFPREFPADAVEACVPDAATARALVQQRYPALLSLLEYRRVRFAPLLTPQATDLIDRTENALLMGFCRLALRHGSWGTDYHPYHNENHILEILDGRIRRLIEAIGLSSLSLQDWLLLELFAACHDLRQRETPEFAAGVGSNERASIEETFRILTRCGFDPRLNADMFQAIELMIAGSTFDARPADASILEYNTAEQVQSGGALAVKLQEKLDKHAPGWQCNKYLLHALDLALIAADLDTANVADSFAEFIASAERLCREREMRSHRSLTSPASARPVLSFLTDGQEYFFLELHRFNSEFGRAAFAEQRQANAAKLKAFCQEVRHRARSHEPLRDGLHVLDCYHTTLADMGKN